MTNEQKPPQLGEVHSVPRGPAGQCGAVFPRFSGGEPEDKHGCSLPAGHQGEHRFICQAGSVVLWQTDWECDCESCKGQDSADWCVVYRVESPVLSPAVDLPDGQPSFLFAEGDAPTQYQHGMQQLERVQASVYAAARVPEKFIKEED